MANRREILQLGMAVTVMPLDSAKGWSTAEDDSNRNTSVLPLYIALYDKRFGASQAFGERMAVRGVATTGLSTGDITALWFNDLYHRWMKEPVAIAGLTARGPLFCLEQLARDHGMRVVYRARHMIIDDGSVLHEVEGPSGVVDLVQRIAVKDSWATDLGDVISRYPHENTSRARVLVHTPGATVSAPRDEPLFSWVIAPIARS